MVEGVPRNFLVNCSTKQFSDTVKKGIVEWDFLLVKKVYSRLYKREENRNL